ncbi:carbohydrate kinase family protein [Deinococcus cellulosilyticus]|uniref:Fructokinase n=1 Tax=Deinococcus cellulosilyticus (strain DSM 18568 / NBRC 106333 / KACC 11606 / 5516J-15) TaxID=1223518 RepID=A0A511N443_DEIC1|nr:carbohydrate kinase [Deinococcus cellulosilyticus]GEM47238.1 fructokinase [Deinococcus cellulosilyticus NBRC 106333 = KACC 11606]
MTLVAVGGVLMDFLRQPDGSWLTRPGGSAWNVARVNVRLGTPTKFLGVISTDPFGEELLGATHDAGIDPALVQRTDHPTSLSFVFQSHPATYAFRAENGSDRQLVPDVNLCTGASLVYIGGISVVRSPLLEQIPAFVRDLHARGISVAYDPNFRAQEAAAYRVLFPMILPYLKYLKVSDEDLAGLDMRLEQIRRLNPDLTVLLTRGNEGAELHTNDGVFMHAGYTVDVRDTVGAGDASIAGFLHHLLAFPDAPPAERLSFALGCGAVACMHPGAYAPSLQEVHHITEDKTCQKH